MERRLVDDRSLQSVTAAPHLSLLIKRLYLCHVTTFASRQPPLCSPVLCAPCARLSAAQAAVCARSARCRSATHATRVVAKLLLRHATAALAGMADGEHHGEVVRCVAVASSQEAQ
jgi:hypothetical protein